MHVIRRNIAILGALIAGVSLAGQARAIEVAPTDTTWYFSGDCTDCSGTATGTLVLTDYTAGAALDYNNFVSFTYDGTNLVNPFTVEAGDLQSITGTLPVPGAAFDLQFNPGIEQYSDGDSAAGSYSYLTIDGSGNWALGNFNNGAENGGTISGASDQGVNAQLTSSAPEPASLALFTAALAGLALLCRRKRLAA